MAKLAGRNQHASRRGPRSLRRHRNGAAAIAATAVIAVLAVAVAVLSYQSATRDPEVGKSDLAALEVRLDNLNRKLTATYLVARRASHKASAGLAEARRNRPTKKTGLAACLVQIQREIDDLQAYLSYRRIPLRARVFGTCSRLLNPRFAG